MRRLINTSRRTGVEVVSAGPERPGLL